MFKFVLIVILASNGRPYSETPVWAQVYKTEDACTAEAKSAKYTDSSRSETVYKKARCVPLMTNNMGQQ